MIAKNMSLHPNHSFRVAEVEPINYRLPFTDYRTAISERVLKEGDILEAYSRETATLASAHVHNAFIEAAKLAYSYHRPLVLSPDMIWLQIAQGLAQHVGLHSEELRSQLVCHANKLKLTVVRNDFVRGFAGNDWEAVIGDFSHQIRAHVGDNVHGLIAPTFSTTSFIERAAFEVTLMDTMQHYFEYEVMCICGIPEITLEGTVDDWEGIRLRAEQIAGLGLDWWLDDLLPVLDQFVAARQGRVDQGFWHGFYRIDGGCGPDVNGHILKLVPYLVNYEQPTPGEWLLRSSGFRRNPLLIRSSDQGNFAGVDSRSIPSGLSSGPFMWKYYATDIPMEFVAGFVGVRQDLETLALRPEIGWAVVEKAARQ